MNPLNLTTINAHADYRVWLTDTGKYIFETDHEILYAVSFDLDDNPFYAAYWFNLTNLSNAKSPGDIKIPQTVICIIEEFFRQNPNILLYLCSTADNQQAQRSRLFLRWFNGAEQQKQYAILTSEVRGEGQMEYVALIAQRTHPQLDAIIQRFEEEIAMFNDMKP